MTRLVIGVGCSLGCPAEELNALVNEARATLGGTVVAIATVDRREGEPCVLALVEALGVPLHTFPASGLAVVQVPTPSAVVEQHVGTSSVAEAAAVLAARGVIVVPQDPVRTRHVRDREGAVKWPE